MEHRENNVKVNEKTINLNLIKLELVRHHRKNHSSLYLKEMCNILLVFMWLESRVYFQKQFSLFSVYLAINEVPLKNKWLSMLNFNIIDLISMHSALALK